MAQPLTQHQVNLRGLSTFGLNATCEQLICLESIDQLSSLPEDHPSHRLILGGGSNTIFLSDWPGTIWLNQIRGLSHRLEGEEVVVEVGAGESWHGLVMHCLEQGWHGLENLALIPGSVGAAPIQNIGAYGVELSSCLEQVVVWDIKRHEVKHLNPKQCQFGYRDSLFKHKAGSDYLIVRVDLRLSKTFTPKTQYESLHRALSSLPHHSLDAKTLVSQIIELRSERLPDPSTLKNAGSFFKNPVVTAEACQSIQRLHPQLPSWPVETDLPSSNGPSGLPNHKISAAWMIDRLGLKGRCIGDICVYDRHALVLVNRGQGSAEALEQLVGEIQTAVYNEFGVQLETEPQLIKA